VRKLTCLVAVVVLACLACLACLASPARAAAPPGIAPAAKKQWKAAMERGRAAEKQKRFPDAVKAFQEALTAVPEEPWAETELGWAAYLAGDLALAETATRKAVAMNGDPHQRGASLYNLGLIAEARGDKALAARAYADSLAARPNKTVRAALLAIDPAAAAAIDPYAPHSMLGPFPTTQAYCKSLKNDDGGACDDCGDLVELGGAAKIKLHEPFDGVHVFLDACADAFGKRANLALHTPAGWFVAANIGFKSDGGHCTHDFKIDDLGWDGAILVVDASGESNCWDAHDEHDVPTLFQATWVTFASVGPSKTPSATPRLNTKLHTEGLGKEAAHDIDLDVKLDSAASSVEVTGRAGSDAADTLGKHPLVFP
jgi:hypothetical protein